MWPGLVSVVCSSGSFKWNGQPAGWRESQDSTHNRLVRVTIREVLWRPGTSKHSLPEAQLDGSVSSSSNQAKSDFLIHFFPEGRHSEDLLGEDVSFLSGLWPLVEVVESFSTLLNVKEGGHLDHTVR